MAIKLPESSSQRPKPVLCEIPISAVMWNYTVFRSIPFARCTPVKLRIVLSRTSAFASISMCPYNQKTRVATAVFRKRCTFPQFPSRSRAGSSRTTPSTKPSRSTRTTCRSVSSAALSSDSRRHSSLTPGENMCLAGKGFGMWEHRTLCGMSEPLMCSRWAQ